MSKELEVRQIPQRTTPKPFVFVLMPFDAAFEDIYKFGIKGAAEDAGAYAERIDEQIFGEGILDRIFSQISRADAIVADMTGRNPNVFYEVGYAHALGKQVLLLTQDANDIPFDLKHRQHTVYSGKITRLRNSLSAKLKTVLEDSKSTADSDAVPRLVLQKGQTTILDRKRTKKTTELLYKPGKRFYRIRLAVRNLSERHIARISHVYALVPAKATIVPRDTNVEGEGLSDVFIEDSERALEPMYRQAALGGSQDCYKIPCDTPITLPPGAAEVLIVPLVSVGEEMEGGTTQRVLLRLHTESSAYEFEIRMVFGQKAPSEQS